MESWGQNKHGAEGNVLTVRTAAVCAGAVMFTARLEIFHFPEASLLNSCFNRINLVLCSERDVTSAFTDTVVQTFTFLLAPRQVKTFKQRRMKVTLKGKLWPSSILKQPVDKDLRVTSAYPSWRPLRPERIITYENSRGRVPVGTLQNSTAGDSVCSERFVTTAELLLSAPVGTEASVFDQQRRPTSVNKTPFTIFPGPELFLLYRN